MRTLLALITLIGLAAIPTDASAQFCDWSLLRNYGRSWAVAQFAGFSCSDAAPPAVGNGCPSPIQNTNRDLCTQSGVMGSYEFIDNISCQSGPMRVYGRIVWIPNSAWTWRYRCTCSEGNNSCVWY